MDKATLHRKVAEFEAAYGYDASYQHELIDAAPGAAAIFATVPLMVDRNAAPAAALLAAGQATMYVEDCQPCSQIGLDMARQAGVPAEVARAIGAEAHVRLGRQARQDGVKHSDNVLGDVCEALIGALWLDGGWEAAKAFVRKAWAQQRQEATGRRNAGQRPVSRVDTAPS